MDSFDCRHYRGHWHNSTCAAGVNLRRLVGGPDLGWAIRLPCTAALREANAERSELPCVPCDRFEPMTAAEVAAEIAEDERVTAILIERFVRIAPALERIKKEHRGRDASGVVGCPVCHGDGTLHFRHAASNGHVWLRCETADCVALME